MTDKDMAYEPWSCLVAERGGEQGDRDRRGRWAGLVGRHLRIELHRSRAFSWALWALWLWMSLHKLSSCCFTAGTRILQAQGVILALGLLQFPQDYQWVLCPFLFAFPSEIYSKQQREMPEGNFSILGKIKICAKIHAYIHVDTCVTETHFLCYLWSIYSNHSKIQLMHNTEKSPAELGRKHETLFCAGKFCSIYYPLFSPSTSSMEPLANPRRLWPALGINICF